MHFEKQKDAISTRNGGSIHRLRQLTYDEKRLVKKRWINHKVSLLFRKRTDRTARSRHRGGKGAEYKVTSHVYFIPVDPIKVPIIISDVFRCNMFDLVSDILWSHICLVNLAAVAPLHKNIKRRCVPRSTPVPGGKILPAIPRDGNSLSCPAAW